MCTQSLQNTDSNSYLCQVLIQELLNWSNHTPTFTVTATATFPPILKYKGSVLFSMSREKFCMDQHDSSNQADGNLCRSVSVAHGKLSGVTGNECRMDDENGSSKHLILELLFFLKDNTDKDKVLMSPPQLHKESKYTGYM